MAGINPYLEVVQIPPPKQSYSLTIYCEGEKHELTIDPRDIPFDRSGQPGSILDICLGNDIPLEHTCGGVIACSTCHIIVKEGLDSCNPSTDDEEDQLDEAPGVTRNSRLGCQCVPNGTKPVVIEVPHWNRNAVKETPH
jgi:ferredoxin, 2Fe-2S